MKVYVLIWWFYDGDSNLVNSFEGVFSTYENTLNKKNEIDTEGREIVNREIAEKKSNESFGGYGSPSFFEIRECFI